MEELPSAVLHSCQPHLLVNRAQMAGLKINDAGPKPYPGGCRIGQIGDVAHRAGAIRPPEDPMRKRARHKKTSLKEAIDIQVEVEAAVEPRAPPARSWVVGRCAGCGRGGGSWPVGARRAISAGLGLMGLARRSRIRTLARTARGVPWRRPPTPSRRTREIAGRWKNARARPSFVEAW